MYHAHYLTDKGIKAYLRTVDEEVYRKHKQMYLNHEKHIEHMADKHSSSRKITCTIKNCDYKTNRIGNYHLHLENFHKIELPLISCYSTGCGKKM